MKTAPALTTVNATAANPSSIKTRASNYKTRWFVQALAALNKQAQDKFLDRRERRLTQAYKCWRSQQQANQQAASA